jgi:hypothetical protein
MSVDIVSPKKIKVILDKERTLFYPMGAYRALAKEYGSVGAALAKFSNVEGLRILDLETLDVIIAWVWAGLKHEDKGITQETVGDILTTDNLAPIIKAIGEALGLAMPEAKESEVKEGFLLEP